MTLSDILEIAAGMLASLGGGALIVFAFSSWLGKVWAGRIMEAEKAKYAHELEGLKARFLLDTERYKTALKKSEFLFEKEYDAASSFVALVRSMRPTFSHPEMDWYEACDDIARSFDKNERLLEAFLSTHGAVLSESVRDTIGRCIGMAGEGKFLVTDPSDVPREANTAAETFFEELRQAESALLEIVRSQSRA